jgi:type II secretory pathway component PulK
VALVCVAVASIFMVVMVRRALGEWKMVRLEARQVQCRWLAESALDRAAARLASDPKYQGETWKIPAARLLGREQAADSESAAVKIDVTTPAGNPLQRLIRVQADWPEAAPERARVTRQATIELSPLKK